MNSRIRPTLYTLATVAPQQLIIQTSHGLNRLKRKCRRLEKKAVKTDLPRVTEIITIEFVISTLHFLKLYVWIINLIDQCVGDSRKLFRVVNSLSSEPFRRLPQSATTPQS